jgi:uncharacterized RDD family membrane protein YckC
MLPENRSFMIRGEDGAEYGPVDLTELREWVQENRAGIGTEVRLDEPGSAWHPWQNYPELIALLAEVQVTSPVPGQPGLLLAPLGQRTLAFAFDLILLIIPTLIVFYTMILVCFPDWVVRDVVAFNQFVQDMESGHQHPFTPPDPPPYALITAELLHDLILILYFSGFVAAHGKTPGKSILHLRVVDQTGKKPTLVKSLVRAFVLVISLGLFLIPFAYIFFNPQRRAFHDLLADTYVVKA